VLLGTVVQISDNASTFFVGSCEDPTSRGHLLPAPLLRRTGAQSHGVHIHRTHHHRQECDRRGRQIVKGVHPMAVEVGKRERAEQRGDHAHRWAPFGRQEQHDRDVERIECAGIKNPAERKMSSVTVVIVSTVVARPAGTEDGTLGSSQAGSRATAHRTRLDVVGASE
jgi:hypothetical protein